MPTTRRHFLLLIVLASCAKTPQNAVEDLTGAQNLSAWKLQRLNGTRDGESLAVRALYTDATGAQLRADLRFKVGVPTHLESGTWQGLGGEGKVAERSVT